MVADFANSRIAVATKKHLRKWMTKAVRIRAPRTCPKLQFRLEEGYGNAQPSSVMGHAVRTLLYELLVEPLLRFLRRMWKLCITHFVAVMEQHAGATWQLSFGIGLPVSPDVGGDTAPGR